MARQDFLVEIGTEELPPKALPTLSKSFADGIEAGLKEANLGYSKIERFAAPRRLAVRISGLELQQPDIQIEKRGPALKAAYDAEGNPSKALEGFLRSCNAGIEQIETLETDKGSWIVFRATQTGQKTEDLLAAMIEKSLSQLPIPKRMRWGSSRVEFVRPVHWIIMLLGETVIDCKILGLQANNQTFGHRFHAPGAIKINTPSEYESKLEQEGKVLAVFEQRREKIRAGVAAIAKTVNGQAVIDESLLDEVTALNEWPVPLLGRFEERFLEVPAEALISSMKEHQKYFHVLDEQGKMLPNFITLANIESIDPSQVIAGNEKVIRPRLSDAAFFYTTDKKQTLESRIEKLKPIVFQAQLGSIYDKSVRVAGLSEKIAGAIGSQPQFAHRAALLAKADLVSEMVLEFPELQGTMGRYYALNDGEPAEVAEAIYEQYLPRFSGDSLPESLTGCAVAIAEKLDSLVGLFGINQPPSGTKDPFALRRAALGILRIIVGKQLQIDLVECIQWAIEQHETLPAKNLAKNVFDYLLERFRAWYDEEGIPAEVYMAVHARRPSKPVDFDRRIRAVDLFRQMDEAQALAAANKRVSNILAKQAGNIGETIVEALLEQEAEKQLARAIESQRASTASSFESGNYAQALSSLATLRVVVDRFFDDVMVMADDEALRNNRLALLNQLRQLFLQVADISLLSA
ncbi:MAG: glycine--tRNA ligase subunit beta [Hahellaceae bacterium]|nr:glycine--tRNA ligase subunit beta [Hahellaceae bacterium]